MVTVTGWGVVPRYRNVCFVDTTVWDLNKVKEKFNHEDNPVQNSHHQKRATAILDVVNSTYNSEQQPSGSSVWSTSCMLSWSKVPIMLSERSLVAVAAASLGVVLTLMLRKTKRIRIAKSILAVVFFSQSFFKSCESKGWISPKK